MLGGYLAGGGFALETIFYILASIGVLGVLLTLLVPTARARELHPIAIEPSLPIAAGTTATARAR